MTQTRAAIARAYDRSAAAWHDGPARPAADAPRGRGGPLAVTQTRAAIARAYDRSAAAWHDRPTRPAAEGARWL